MKYTLALLFALCLSAHGQALRNINGFGTNTTLLGNTRVGPGNSVTNLNEFGNMSIKGTTVSLGSPLGPVLLVWTNSVGPEVTSISITDIGILFDVDQQGGLQPIDLVISTNRITAPNIVSTNFIGNGAGLTNLIGATNFSSTVTYNFNGKTTFNSVSYNTNAWAGPTNSLTLTTNYQFFVASTDCNINGIAGRIADQNTWTTLTISNSTAGDITVRSTASGIRPQGSSTLAALVVGAGKEGYLTYHCRGFLSTNYVTTAQQ